MMLLRSPIKAVFALATAISLLVSSSKAHESGEHESSEACLNETAIVQSNAGVMSAIEAAINGTLTLEDPLTCSSGSSTLSCSYDSETASSNVDSACTAAGGQFVVYNFTLTCDVTADGTTKEVTYVFTNPPNCIGDSCDPSMDHENSDTFTDGIVDKLNNFTAIDNCAVVQEDTSPAPSRGAKIFLVIAGALLASMFLF